MIRRRALAALLALAGGLPAACQDDVCKQSTPAVELALDLAPALDLTGVDTVRVSVDWPLGKLAPEPLSVMPAQLAQRPMTIKLTLGTQSGAAVQLPAGVTLRLTATVELLAGTRVVARGSASFTPTFDACNFINVPLGAATGQDGGAAEAGSDAGPGPG